MTADLATPPPVIVKWHERYCELTRIKWELNDSHINYWWRALCLFGVIQSRTIEVIGTKQDLANHIKARFKIYQKFKRAEMLRIKNVLDEGLLKEAAAIARASEQKSAPIPREVTQLAACLREAPPKRSEEERKQLQLTHADFFEQMRKDVFG